MLCVVCLITCGLLLNFCDILVFGLLRYCVVGLTMLCLTAWLLVAALFKIECVWCWRVWIVVIYYLFCLFIGLIWCLFASCFLCFVLYVLLCSVEFVGLLQIVVLFVNLRCFWFWFVSLVACIDFDFIVTE